MSMRNGNSGVAWKRWVVLLLLPMLLPVTEALADWQITDYAGTDEDPSIAWNGSHYLISWTRHRNDTTFVYAQRVTSSREFAGDEFAVWDPILSSSPGDARYPQVAGSGGGGSRWLVIWRNEYGGVMEIRGRIIHSDGTPTETVLTIGTTNYASPTPVVAWNGEKWLVVWEGYQSSVRFIEGRFVYVDGSMGPVMTIDFEAGIQKYRPRVGALGMYFLVAWMDRRDGVYNIYDRAMDTNGNVGTRTQVSNCDGTDYTNTVSGGSTYFLVTWRCLGTGGNAHIWGRRTTNVGAVVGSKFEISSDQINNSGAAAWTGSYFKVAYDLLSLGPYYRAVYEDASMGTETDLSSLLSSGAGTYVANAQADTNCLCVWEANIGNRDIYANGPGIPTSVESESVPGGLDALAIAPNPVRPGCGTVEFSIPRKAAVQIDVYNVEGRRVATVVRSELDPGSYSVPWSAGELPSGLYFVKLVTDGGAPVTKKVVFLR